MLYWRLLVGLPLAALVIALLLYDGYLWDATLEPGAGYVGLGLVMRRGALSTAVVLIFSLLASRELVRLARAHGYGPFGGATYVFVAFLVLMPIFRVHFPRGGTGEVSGEMFLLALALIATFAAQVWRQRSESGMVNMASTLFIILYCGGLMSFLVRLRLDAAGMSGVVLVLYSMLLVKMTDTGAYFTGRLLGRQKMIEWLSPKKTWEGFVGGVVCTMGLAVGAGLPLHRAGYLPLAGEGWMLGVALLIFGLLMAGFSVAGDLCASLLKRDASVKDSGRALPGLGGVLDVLDSPLMAAPIAWAFWSVMRGME